MDSNVKLDAYHKDVKDELEGEEDSKVIFGYAQLIGSLMYWHLEHDPI